MTTKTSAAKAAKAAGSNGRGKVAEIPLPEGTEVERVSNELVYVTPEIAAQWLGAMAKNRPVASEKVEEYTGKMEKGQWMCNGESIKFSRSGKLIDGQHRLLAVIAADRPVRIEVRRGLPEEAFLTLDTGFKRTAGAALTLSTENRIQNYNTVAAALRKVCLWETVGLDKKGSGKNRPTNIDIVAALDRHPGVIDATAFVLHHHCTDIISGGIAAPLFYIFSTIDAEEAERFWYQLCTGLELTDTSDAVYRLRQRLLARKVARVRDTEKVLLALCIKAWNFRRTNTPCQKLLYTTDPKKAEEFPVPI